MLTVEKQYRATNLKMNTRKSRIPEYQEEMYHTGLKFKPLMFYPGSSPLFCIWI